MKLSDAAALCPGLRLHFIPKYGWGWKAPADKPDLSYETIERSGGFALDAASAFQWKGQLRGFYGKIAEKHHPLTGYNFILWSMGEGDVDFTADPAVRWDIFFSTQPFRDDHVDFADQEEAGVGYGTPILERSQPAEPGAAPNGGPSEQLGKSGAGGGPPSVS